MEDIYLRRVRRLILRHNHFIEAFSTRQAEIYHSYFNRQTRAESLQEYAVSLSLLPCLCYLKKEELIIIAFLASASHNFVDSMLSNEVCFVIEILKHMRRD